MVASTVAGVTLIVLILWISRAQEWRIIKGTPPPLMPGMVLDPSGLTDR
jgi:hypothetical protein